MDVGIFRLSRELRGTVRSEAQRLPYSTFKGIAGLEAE